jgi:ParB/RepB/Spo0J family partition protein
MAKSVKSASKSSLSIEPTKDISRFRDFFTTRKDLGGHMDPRLIRIEKGHNPRDYRLPENRAHLDSLKISIGAVGVRQPLLCRLDGGQCVLVDGESRLTAVLELIKEGAEILTVPVMQVNANNEADRIAIAVGANTGKPLSGWELGGAFARLQAFGWDDEKIAAQFGITTQKVAQCVELADMPQDVKQLLSERAITPALAITTVRRKGSKAASEELKDKADKHKAAGKKGPAKSEKAESEENKLLRLIFENIEADGYWKEKEQEGGFASEFFYITLGHAKRLEKLLYPKGK